MKLNDFKSTYSNKLIYLYLQQPIDILFYPHDEQFIIKFNRDLKSLVVYNSTEHKDPIPQQQQLETIYMESIGNYLHHEDILIKNINPLLFEDFDFSMIDYNNHYDKSPKYVIDQHAFENIHQFCPLLSSLTIENPECYSYSVTKYPHLESFSIYPSFRHVTKEEEKKEHQYEKAILGMFHQLLSLQKLSNVVYQDIYTNEVSSQFNYLNYLTSLSMGLNNVTQLAYTFLSEKMNTTTVVSTLSKELIFEKTLGGQDDFIYMYDWLKMFPNLTLFHIKSEKFSIS
ncbi:unnamed protein product [Cunninghamella blakesleeana]